MSDEPLKPGDRVRYRGVTPPGLNDREGTFIRYDRNGWAVVKFDCNPVGRVKCAHCNVEKISADA